MAYFVKMDVNEKIQKAETDLQKLYERKEFLTRVNNILCGMYCDISNDNYHGFIDQDDIQYTILMLHNEYDELSKDIEELEATSMVLKRYLGKEGDING